MSVAPSLQLLYPLLPGLLDCNPFRGSADPAEPADTSSYQNTPALQAPEEVQIVVEVLSRTWALLTESQLHPDIRAQLVGYLFYFINASLFNSLMERGSEVGFYQWSRGVQMRASLDLLLDWAQDKGLGELASEQTLKLTCALNLLATPRKTLLKSFWGSLRSLYPALHPAQLHHLLSLYRTPSHLVPPHRSAWSPCESDQAAALHTSDILESFDSHHPLVLPEGGYHFHLEAPVDGCGLKQQLHELRNFIHKSREQQVFRR
uniref:Dilute domain-containing protein n=1 Tax=Knipowitschia caucasica TaxID=637954 RepID=A0AAV2MPV8_KNICA